MVEEGGWGLAGNCGKTLFLFFIAALILESRKCSNCMDHQTVASMQTTRASQIVTKTVEGTALSGYETSALCVSNHYNLYHYIEELHSLDLTVKSNNV